MKALRLTVAAISVALSACAYESEVVPFSYTASPPAQTAPAAVTSEVVATDLRSRRDRFSSKTDAYGREEAPISATEPVPSIIENAISAELQARGYPVGAGGARIEVLIRVFYTRFQDHHDQLFKQDTADARVVLDVSVRRQGRIAYSRIVSGYNSIRAPTQLHWGGTAVESLSEALRRALTQLFDDAAFRRALALQSVEQGRGDWSAAASLSRSNNALDGSSK